jgi:hypothetical protein
MIKNDAWLFIGTAAFFVAVFGMLQLAGWRSNRAIVGGTRRFAQLVLAGGLGATSVLALVLLAMTLDLTGFRGWPFVLLYTLTLLSPLVVPAMLTIEIVLVVELFLARQTSPTVRRWHVGALLSCLSWMAVAMIALMREPN